MTAQLFKVEYCKYSFCFVRQLPYASPIFWCAYVIKCFVTWERVKMNENFFVCMWMMLFLCIIKCYIVQIYWWFIPLTYYFFCFELWAHCCFAWNASLGINLKFVAWITSHWLFYYRNGLVKQSWLVNSWLPVFDLDWIVLCSTKYSIFVLGWLFEQIFAVEPCLCLHSLKSCEALPKLHFLSSCKQSLQALCLLRRVSL